MADIIETLVCRCLDMDTEQNISGLTWSISYNLA
jgi:hypothetical protein